MTYIGNWWTELTRGEFWLLLGGFSLVIAGIIFLAWKMPARISSAPAPTGGWSWPSKTTWGKVWRVIRTLLLLGVILGGLWLWCRTVENETRVEAKVESMISQKKRADPTLREYEYSQDSYPGENQYGDHTRYRAPKKTGKAFIIVDNREALTFRVEYVEEGKLQTVLFTLDKTLDEPVGVWIQEKPRYTGKWFLNKNQLIRDGYCLSFMSDAVTSLGWRNAYLKPK